MSSAVVPRVRPTDRLPVLDALRGTAILCMLVAHGVPFLWPTGVSRALELTLGAVNAVASPLFGLVMGASAALVWSRPATRRTWPRRVLTDVGRGLVLVVLGTVLVELGTWVAIVLHVLGVLMVIGIPVAVLAGTGATQRTARWILGGLVLALFAAAPWVTGVIAPSDERLANGTTGGWAELWAALTAGYSYRALSLLPFFAVGALVATVGLFQRPGRLGRLALLAAALLVPAYTLVRRSRDIALSGDWVDQLFDLTLVAVAGAVIAAAMGARPRAALWRPLIDLGAVALSVYALQLVVLRPLMAWDAWASSRPLAWVSLLTLVLVPSALMIGWRRTLGPGPLERVVALVTGKGRAT